MRIILYIFLFSFLSLQLSAQTTQTEFGKNRVQFHQEFGEWSQYESRNFITFWYGEGRNIGQSVVQMAEYDFADIQGVLEHRMNDKIEIIVYKDLTDLKQSNIGSEEAFENTGGQTKIVGNKMFVYFNGDHNDLRRQIREGVASVYLNAMLFGSNLQEIVQNAVMMNLPQWFKDGLIAYVGENWNTDLDNRLRDALVSEDYVDFETLAEKKPKLAGHSLWYFISRNYGTSSVSNLLYLTRMNRSLDNGFLYVLGGTFTRTVENWEDFYKKRFDLEKEGLEKPEGLVKVKNKKNLPLYQLKISPNGRKIAYVINEIGRYKIYVQDVKTGERDLIFKGGFRNAIQATDYNYPLLAWNPSGMELGILYEKRDALKFLKYETKTKDKIEEPLPNQFQRVYSMDYITPNDLVFSATVRGHGDLFRYFTHNRQAQRLTNDHWDDLDAVYTNIRGHRGILFASNRPDSMNIRAKLDTILPIQKFDIFYLNLDAEDKTELVRVTNTPYSNDRNPSTIDSTWFSYLSDESGITNRRTGYLEDYVHHLENVITFEDGEEMRLHADSIITEILDSTALAAIDTVVLDTIIKQRGITHFNTNYDRNIEELSIARRSNKSAQIIYRNGAYRFYVNEVSPIVSKTPVFTDFQNQKLEFIKTITTLENAEEEEPIYINITVLEEDGKKKPLETEAPKEAEPDSNKIDIDNYLFQSEFDEEEVPTTITDKVEEEDENEAQFPSFNYRPAKEKSRPEKKVHKFRPGRITPYRLKFRTDYVTTQLDNSLLFDGLNSYSGVPDNYGYPPPGILIKANFKDLFEDYEFEGGVRIPTSFNGTEYFLFLDDKKKRLDKRYAIYRRRLKFSDDLQTSSPSPPKYENIIVLGQYQARYPLDIFTSIRGTVTLRFDNTTRLATDALTLQIPSENGQRLGLKLEYVFDNTLDIALNIKNGTRYKIFGELVKGFEVDFGENSNFSLNDGFMTIVGGDFRHYQRLLKHSVLAARVAVAASFGKEKILYLLGGTDNWLFPKFNNEIPLPAADDFVYQSVATNTRGFELNIRNGNSYALLNTELRMPLFRYLFPRTKSSFFRNFQAIGFFDAGTAWQGLNPFNEESPLNTATISNPQVTVQVNYFRDPIVFGYGFGIRTVLFGYFVRLDYGWGVETRQIQKARLHFSIGMDF